MNQNPGRRVATLRFSLLASLGLIPIACGGTVDGSEDGNGGSTIAVGARAARGGNVGTGGSAVTTGGAVTTTGGSAPTTGGTNGNAWSCTSPTFDPATQLMKCAEGPSHRANRSHCNPGDNAAGAGGSPSERPAPPPGGSPSILFCTTDAECSSLRHGVCVEQQPVGRVCREGCVEDGDCDASQVCSCRGAGSYGECVGATCAASAECGDQSACVRFEGACGGSYFACKSPEADECTTHADCSNGETCYAEGGVRRCSGLVCGRPFLVQATPRMAAVVQNRDWLESDALRPELSHLSPAERQALAAHWARMGQMEHASIAAFAHFSLQLLALGAPSNLVDSCTQALADETAHTKLCFQLASAYAGKPLGPGPLDVQHSLDITTLTDIVDLVIAEGCFGETIAALEAVEAAETATDPVVQQAYARIASDEQRHAELAFKFVAWALTQGGEGVAQRLTAALQDAPVEHRAARDVVLPCLAALLNAKEFRPALSLPSRENARVS